MHIETTLYVEREIDGEDIEIELRVEGYYTPGERASWGYSGGNPASPAEVEIGDISEVLVVEGPLRYRERGPLQVETPWEGELTKDEEETAMEQLFEAARRD